MNRDDITVNGQMLGEFLKTNESVSEEIERNKFFNEQTETVRLGRHVKARYKPYREKNGEVIKLGQREINIANYEKYLLQSIQQEKILNSFVIVMMANPDYSVFTTGDIAEIIEKFQKKFGIPVLRRTSHSLRGRLGMVRKSELCDFMFFLIVIRRKIKRM